MTKRKNTRKIKIGQRKALAVFMLGVAFMGSNVSITHAEAAITPANQSALVSTVSDATSAQSASTEPESADGPMSKPTVQDVLLHVCEENGYGQDCAKTLLGMLWTESSNRSTVQGDQGRARGYFQIWYKLHKIPVSCAEDLVCSANWSLNYLEAHNYPKSVSYAVQCHNSCNVNNGYAAKVLRNGKTMWNQPLDIVQAKPIELAVK